MPIKPIMPETWYRASRACRVLGNPTAYLIVKTLAKSEKTPTELAEIIGSSLPNISQTIRHLREVDIVRYRIEGSTKVYGLKSRVALNAMELFEEFANEMRLKKH